MHIGLLFQLSDRWVPFSFGKEAVGGDVSRRQSPPARQRGKGGFLLIASWNYRGGARGGNPAPA